MIDITPIVNLVIRLAIAIFVVLVLPKVYEASKTSLSNAELEYLKEIIKTAVRAAEQIYKASPKSGSTKKKYVLDFLEKQGYTVNTDEISALIEATVNELFPVSEVE